LSNGYLPFQPCFEERQSPGIEGNCFKTDNLIAAASGHENQSSQSPCLSWDRSPHNIPIPDFNLFLSTVASAAGRDSGKKGRIPFYRRTPPCGFSGIEIISRWGFLLSKRSANSS
jgi:hypothetical protein